jgi:uncharacterized protein (DUF488 family)
VTQIYTIGHSTHPIDEFLSMLNARGIELVVDIRAIPKSGHNPQCNSDTLSRSLKEGGIGYLHMKELGGLRRPKKDSPNRGWRNSSFQGFADYMLTRKFDASLRQLTEIAEKQRAAIMCAEAVPWRCHRSLISDALLVHGIRVIHIIGGNSTKEHELTSWARVDQLRIIYPGNQE